MRRPYAVELCLATALVLTLAVKIATGFARRDTTISGPRWDVPIKVALERSGFDVDNFLRDRDPPLLPAQKVGCNMLIANVSPLGWHRHVLSRLVRTDEHLLFAYQGAAFQEQPVWRTGAHYHWDRVLSYVGLSGPDEPVLGIIATRSCGPTDLNWFILDKAR